MSTCIALLRGINVGRAKRIAMADLRSLVIDLGHTNVRTVLNSGNVVFETTLADTSKLALGIQQGITTNFGFSAEVVVIKAKELARIIEENPLREVNSDSSRFLVAFMSKPAILAKVEPLLQDGWGHDRLAIGKRAAYIWCANGIIESKLLQAFARLTGEAATTRNWSTVLRLHIAASNRSAA